MGQRVEEPSSYGTGPYMFKSENIVYVYIYVFEPLKNGMKLMKFNREYW